MKVIVCGGRDFRSPAQVFSELERLHGIHHFSQLMQGGARGVDRFARDWASTHPEIERYVCRAGWDRYQRAAGPIRNARMLEWGPDLVIAFPGGDGTKDMATKARAAGVEVIFALDALIPQS